MIRRRLMALAICMTVLAGACLTASCKKISSDGTSLPSIPGAETDPTGQPGGDDMYATGEWEITEDPTVTGELKTVYDSSTAGTAAKDYEILAYLGCRSRMGLDYCFLCLDPEGTYKLVDVYENINSVYEFVGEAELQWPGTASASMIGSWKLSEDPGIRDYILDLTGQVSVEAPDRIYSAVTYLGSQFVSGRKHAVLCITEPKNPPSPAIEYDLYLITIFEGTEGKPELFESNIVDISSYFPATN